MPYKDSERKKEWERLHRPQRLARRRELRRIGAAQQAARPEGSTARPQSGAGFPVPPATGGDLAAYNPKLGIAAGGATLAIAGISKKGWRWWKVGLVLLAAAVAVALFLYLYIQAVESQLDMEG